MPVDQPPSYYRYFRTSYRREPNWRWEVSNNYLRYSQDAWIVADRWLGTAWNIRRNISSQPGTPAYYGRVAQVIWQTNRQVRWELEARILTGQSRQEISGVMGLPVKVITAYERLFFDVRERLPAKDYIVGYVLKRTELFKPQQVDRIWAYFAYVGGVIALADLLEHFRELQLTDYSYLLTEPEPRKNRPPLQAAIERTLLVELTRDLDPALLLAKVGPALYNLPVIPDLSVFHDSWQEVTAGLAEFDKPLTEMTDATEAVARKSG